MNDIRDPKLYETWSEEDLRDHIKSLKEILRAKDGSKPETTRALIAGMFDPKNRNFLGSGLSLEDWIVANGFRDFQESFTSQNREEKKRRLNLIVLMSAELVKIREVERFATGLAEAAIEAVIEGNWNMAREWAQHFTFEDDGPEVADKYGSLWSRFRELCIEAFETRPGAPPPEPSETRH